MDILSLPVGHTVSGRRNGDLQRGADDVNALITIEIDASRLQRRIEELNDALIGAGRAGDAATIFLDESRRFAEMAVRVTPPKNRAQGEAAVARDLDRIFSYADEELLNVIGSAHGTRNIDAWFESKDKKKIHVKWNRVDPTGAGMKDFHLANLNARGHTRNLKHDLAEDGVWTSPYMVAKQDYIRYRDAVQSRVGRRKAAWGKSVVKLSGRLAAWINRHLGIAKGECVISYDKNNPGSLMVNGSVGIEDDERLIRDVVRIRSDQVGRRCRLVLSGYSKDVATGMKISRKEHSTQGVIAE